MKCIKIKPLMSLYIDSELDHKTSNDVESHLKTCRQCEAYHASMKKMIGILRSTEKVQAPADFLYKLHKRIEQDSWKNRLRQILYIPKNIRYPLDIIALGTTAVLVFIVFSMLQIPKQSVFTPPNEGMLAESEIRLPDTTANRKEVLQAESTEQEPIQMALFLGPEAFDINNTTQQDKDQSLDLNRPVTIDRDYLYRVDSETDDIMQSSPESILFPDISPGHGNNTEVEDLLNELMYPLQAKAEHRYITNKTVSDINQILLFESGRIISLELEPETGQPEFLSIQVPGSNYNSLVEKLAAIGNLEISPFSQPENIKPTAQIRIQIIPPQ